MKNVIHLLVPLLTFSSNYNNIILTHLTHQKILNTDTVERVL